MFISDNLTSATMIIDHVQWVISIRRIVVTLYFPGANSVQKHSNFYILAVVIRKSTRLSNLKFEALLTPKQHRDRLHRDSIYVCETIPGC